MHSICGNYDSVCGNFLVIITSFNMYEASVSNISTCTDVVGCNEQVLVPTSSQLELPYTYTLAERYPFNMVSYKRLLCSTLILIC